MKSWRFPRFALPALAAVLALGTDAAAGVQAIDAAGIQKLLREEPRQVLLLDVRTRGEFASGRIPGSVLIPMNQVPESLGSIPRGRKVVAICASGARSGAVAKFLADRGYPWVANYEGGMMDWSRRGLPVER